MSARLLRLGAVVLAAGLLAACGAKSTPSAHPTKKKAPHTQAPVAAGRVKKLWRSAGPTSVLPDDVLIADSHNNRILLVNPQKQIIWQYPAPGQTSQLHDDDDVFFGPHFDQIITNQEGYNVISILNFKTGKIVWNYGHGGIPGDLPGYLNTPDDAFLFDTPRGEVVTTADIKNQRILFIDRATSSIIKQYGETGVMAVNPPTTYAAPNGDFPAPHGGMLITQIGGNDAILLNKQGQVQWTVHFPSQFYYPSDANFTPHGNIIVAFYTDPGAVVEMSPTGQVLWEYQVPSGPGMLNHPSLAVKLSNGMVMLNDDYNDRVIIINPKTNQIVWQYGHTGVPGTAAGYLNIPDGMDVLPPGVVPGGKNPIGGHLWSYSGNGL